MTEPEQLRAASDAFPLSHRVLSVMRDLCLEKDPRCAGLAMRGAFAEGSQHDHLGLNWDSCPRDPGSHYLAERMAPAGYIAVDGTSLGMRAPDAPVPLASMIVSHFTEMLLGTGKRPDLCVPDDEDGTAALDAALKLSGWWEALAQVRNWSGARGGAGIAFSVTDGRMRCEALRPEQLWIEWKAGRHWEPAVVVRQVRRLENVVDTETGKLVVREVLRTTAWTETEVITYEPVVGKPEKDKPIKVATDGRKEHGFGRCPVVWHQNLWNTDGPDGDSDYEGLWRQMDKADRVQSQGVKSAIANADPTLAIADEDRIHRKLTFLRKGSRGVIKLSTQGKASYVESSGEGARIAFEAAEILTNQVLQASHCVIVTPEVIQAYTSGEAMQIAWRAMESKCDMLRGPLERTIIAGCELHLAALTRFDVSDDPKETTKIYLPPRKVLDEPEEEPAPREPGDPYERKPPPEEHWEPHTKPSGHTAIPTWPPYWRSTAKQILDLVTGIRAAAGDKQILSAESATRILAGYLAIDADQEVHETHEEREESKADLDSQILLGMPEDPVAAGTAEGAGKAKPKAQGQSTPKPKAKKPKPKA